MDLFGEAELQPVRVTRTFHPDGTKEAPAPVPTLHAPELFPDVPSPHSGSIVSGSLSLGGSAFLNLLISCVLGTFCVVLTPPSLHGILSKRWVSSHLY